MRLGTPRYPLHSQLSSYFSTESRPDNVDPIQQLSDLEESLDSEIKDLKKEERKLEAEHQDESYDDIFSESDDTVLYNIGMRYLKGEHVERDVKQGFALLTQAALAGSVDAKFQLAYLVGYVHIRCYIEIVFQTFANLTVYRYQRPSRNRRLGSAWKLHGVVTFVQ